ncbi:MAG: endonuclease/exonuclease/phosphatase family protein [Rhodobacteraceae bacterium]|nr:endonuclease/exonuclease/phosphatase family protein [Paracoccaceae bacterium]
MLRWLALFLALVWPGLSGAGTVRIAFFTAELDRAGPGLLLRDLQGGTDAQIDAVVQVVAAASPDVLLLARVDYDLDGAALAALAERIGAAGSAYPFRLALRPNSGDATDLDLDGDGRFRGAGDAQGWGEFAGQNGMAVLSKLPIETSAVRDFTTLLWRDLPGATLPRYPDGSPFPSDAAQAILRLASTGFWDIPVILPDDRRLHVLAFHATPPVFDGEEDRNGLRNRDELRFWPLLLDGALPWPAPRAPFVLIGNTNVDPDRGEGFREAAAALVGHGTHGDPAPESAGGTAAGHPRATAIWTGDGQPGALRLDYVLPSVDLEIANSGVVWPAPGMPDAAAVDAASHHRLVWVDIELPDTSIARSLP